MQAYRIETTVIKGQKLLIEDVPFAEGSPVEVIVLKAGVAKLATKERYPLRGKPYRYDSPTEPVAVDDWEALK